MSISARHGFGLRTGRQIVVGNACASCHTVRGTSAAGVLGPDLTHVASRSYMVAGILPMTRGSIAAWVADPQSIKPRNNMPMVPLTGDELPRFGLSCQPQMSAEPRAIETIDRDLAPEALDSRLGLVPRD